MGCASLGALEIGRAGLFSLLPVGAVLPAVVAAMAHGGFPARPGAWRVVGFSALGGVLGLHALVGTSAFGAAAPVLASALVLTGAALGVERLSRDDGQVSDERLHDAVRRATDDELLEAWVRTAAELRAGADPRACAAVVRHRAALLDELLRRAGRDHRHERASRGGAPDDPFATGSRA
ncbi:hypothetical protein [Trujillonella humicola]|uniref:hypothetical protein n=1 Tax=Trujillonella humicola TaxID=3383699 RepID=UPI003905F4DD